jgi:hypothetical protein
MDFLVGVKEAGEILGWDRRKVSTYHLRGVLPRPVADLSSGPIWFRKQIEYYKVKKELGIMTFFISHEKVFECKQNYSLRETRYSPKQIREKEGNHIIFCEEDITRVKKAIVEKDPIVQFISFEWISFLYDVGLIQKEMFEVYLQQLSYETSEVE